MQSAISEIFRWKFSSNFSSFLPNPDASIIHYFLEMRKVGGKKSYSFEMNSRWKKEREKIWGALAWSEFNWNAFPTMGKERREERGIRSDWRSRIPPPRSWWINHDPTTTVITGEERERSTTELIDRNWSIQSFGISIWSNRGGLRAMYSPSIDLKLSLSIFLWSTRSYTYRCTKILAEYSRESLHFVTESFNRESSTRLRAARNEFLYHTSKPIIYIFEEAQWRRCIELNETLCVSDRFINAPLNPPLLFTDPDFNESRRYLDGCSTPPLENSLKNIRLWYIVVESME